MQTTTNTAVETKTSTKATYAIDLGHSHAGFTVRHLMIANVRGEFTKLEGKVTWDPANPEGTEIEATIDASSINTREPQRDAHLRSADFFDVENHPSLTFKSKSAKVGKDGLEVTGDLTIRGTTRQVTLAVEGPTPEQKDPWGGTRMAASATTKINRKDFGLTWNSTLETGGVLVGDEIKIALEVELIRK